MRPDTFGLFEAVEKLKQETTPALYTFGNARKKAGSFMARGLNRYAEFTAAFQSAQTLFDLVRATQGLSPCLSLLMSTFSLLITPPDALQPGFTVRTMPPMYPRILRRQRSISQNAPLPRA